MEKSRRRALFGVSIGHAAHDTWYGVAPVLLAALSSQMDISNADIGLMLLFYQGLSSLSQPFFGRLAERVGGRVIGVAAILWTTATFSITLFAQTKWLLFLAIALAGLGSGAWHPQAAANATLAGGERWGATAAAIFFFGGTLGTAFLGSAFGGYLLANFGRHSLLIISAITVLLALTVVRASIPRWVDGGHSAKKSAGQQRNGTMDGAFWRLLLILLLGTAFRSLAFNSLNTYVPKYQQDLGVSPATYGALMSAFLFAAAVGGVVGSYLADRIGLRRVLVGSVALAALFLVPFTQTQGLLSYVLLTVAGLLVGPSHTLFLVAGQRQFPQRVAMISGIFLGFTFVSGAGGAWLLGLWADRVGLATALGVLPWFLLGAALCAFVGVPRGAATGQKVSAEEEATS